MNCEKITSVKVSKLFNQFTYQINLHDEKKIAILIGPNGTGKTTIMDFMSFVFMPTSYVLKKIIDVPFEEFSFRMTNGMSFTIHKTNHAQDDESHILPQTITLNYEGPNSHCKINFEELISRFRHQVLSYSRDLHTRATDRKVSNNELRNNRFAEIDYVRFAKLIANEISIATNDFLPDTDSFQFIRANRFAEREASDIDTLPPSQHRKPDMVDPLAVIESEMRTLCRTHSNEYLLRLQDASFALPKLYLDEDERNLEDMSYEGFKERLEAYQTKISQYAEIGLIDFNNKPDKHIWAYKDAFKKNGLVNLRVNKTIYDSKKEFLILYLKVFERTLGFFDSTYSKLKLFIDIFNKRNEITKKTMRCTSEGILIEANGSILSIHDLSSGEKNDLIMFYELIFGTGSIVFIDEPEISLHIEWQSDFLNQLIEICKENDVQAVVATHSPYIIYGHDELVADKQVVEYE